MNKRKAYFIKQKLIGVMVVIFTLLAIMVTDNDVYMLITIPMGLMLIFSKTMIWMDDYYFEVQRRKERRKGSKN